jgi:hypothetical protein
MCSIPGVAGNSGQVDRLGRLGRAIDELADAAQAQDGGMQDGGMQDGGMQDGGMQDGGMQEVAAHLARVWEMVADLDPELARRLAGYNT